MKVCTPFETLQVHDMMTVLDENSGCDSSGAFEGAKLHHFDVAHGQAHASCRISNRESEKKTADQDFAIPRRQFLQEQVNTVDCRIVRIKWYFR